MKKQKHRKAEKILKRRRQCKIEGRNDNKREQEKKK